jgi:hypothetical protein
MDNVNCYVVPQTTGTGRNIFQGGSPLSSSLPLLGVQLVLIVAVTRVLYFLLKPLKQPRVVSEIMVQSIIYCHADKIGMIFLGVGR